MYRKDQNGEMAYERKYDWFLKRIGDITTTFITALLTALLYLVGTSYVKLEEVANGQLSMQREMKAMTEKNTAEIAEMKQRLNLVEQKGVQREELNSLVKRVEQQLQIVLLESNVKKWKIKLTEGP